MVASQAVCASSTLLVSIKINNTEINSYAYAREASLCNQYLYTYTQSRSLYIINYANKIIPFQFFYPSHSNSMKIRITRA